MLYIHADNRTGARACASLWTSRTAGMCRNAGMKRPGPDGISTGHQDAAALYILHTVYVKTYVTYCKDTKYLITLSINIYAMKTCDWIPLPLNAVHMAILLKEMALPVLILIKTKLFSEEISYRMIFPEDRTLTDSVAEEICNLKALQEVWCTEINLPRKNF